MKKGKSNTVTVKEFIEIYRNRAKELHGKNPKLYVSPKTAMRKFWARLKVSFIELVQEGKIDVNDPNIDFQSNLTMVIQRDIEKYRQAGKDFFRYEELVKSQEKEMNLFLKNLVVK